MPECPSRLERRGLYALLIGHLLLLCQSDLPGITHARDEYATFVHAYRRNLSFYLMPAQQRWLQYIGDKRGASIIETLIESQLIHGRAFTSRIGLRTE